LFYLTAAACALLAPQPANVIISRNPTTASPLQLIDFGSALATRTSIFSRPVQTLDPLYAAPELRLNPLYPDRFDVFSVALVGVRVLLPSCSSERALREFRSRLAAVDFDLRRVRDELYGGPTTVPSDARGFFADLAALFDTQNADAVAIFNLLHGMLRKNPANRSSVQTALQSQLLLL
jgi:serine/threonine protein kinase